MKQWLLLANEVEGGIRRHHLADPRSLLSPRVLSVVPFVRGKTPKAAAVPLARPKGWHVVGLGPEVPSQGLVLRKKGTKEQESAVIS